MPFEHVWTVDGQLNPTIFANSDQSLHLSCNSFTVIVYFNVTEQPSSARNAHTDPDLCLLNDGQRTLFTAVVQICDH